MEREGRERRGVEGREKRRKREGESSEREGEHGSLKCCTVAGIVKLSIPACNWLS